MAGVDEAREVEPDLARFAQDLHPDQRPRIGVDLEVQLPHQHHLKQLPKPYH